MKLCGSEVAGAKLCGERSCAGVKLWVRSCGSEVAGVKLYGSEVVRGAKLCGSEVAGVKLYGSEVAGMKWRDTQYCTVHTAFATFGLIGAFQVMRFFPER